MQHDPSFNQHVFGMWFGFVFIASLISYFITNMAQALRNQDRVLAAAREHALRDENLVALGTLAAGAAHELGTPLNTMAIITDELRQDYPPQKDSELDEQLSMISKQIVRCKKALSVISASTGELRADAGEARPVNAYLQALIQQWKKEQPNIILQQHINGDAPGPRLIADIALDQAISNILNNAAEVSPEWVDFRAEWKPQSLTLKISDHGPGFSPAALAHIGKSPFSEKENGMGMGLLLAHSVINRLGGQLDIDNEQQGACVRITLPLQPAIQNEYTS